LPYIMGDHVEGSEIIPWVISFAIFFVVPFWKLFKRTGFKPVFSIIALIPGGVLLLLWVVAFAKWPAFAEKKNDSSPSIAEEKKDSGSTVAEENRDSGPPIAEEKRDSSPPVVEEKKDSGPPIPP
jgi:hypothetical protein